MMGTLDELRRAIKRAESSPFWESVADRGEPPGSWTKTFRHSLDEQITALGEANDKTCAHCGRICGNYAGGWGRAEGVDLCHPNDPDRPDCYRQVTLYRHQLRDCAECTPMGIRR